MANDPDALISLDGVTKVLSPTKWRRTRWPAFICTSRRASTCRSPGRRAAANPRCSRFWVCSIRPVRRLVRTERQAGAEPEAVRTRAHPQSRNRIHFPGVQSDRRPDRVRERGASAHLSRDAVGRAQEARARCAGARGHVASHQALSVAALGRSAAARRRGASLGRRSFHPAGGRADRKPGFRPTAKLSWNCCANCIAAAQPFAW